MKVTQNRETQRIYTIGNKFSTQIPVGPVYTKIVFSDGTIISKYGNTNYWTCVMLDIYGLAREEAIQVENLLTYLPESAAEELIYNMDTFIRL